QRNVHRAWRRHGQGSRKLPLAARGVQQVDAADHVRDALGRIVHHNHELIGPETVGAPDDEIAHVACHVLALRSEQAVLEGLPAWLDAEAPRWPWSGMRPAWSLAARRLWPASAPVGPGQPLAP